MIENTALMSKEDRVIYTLKNLYKTAGYSEFKMRRFEEYSIYVENKSFLTSEYVITFNDLNGKLLALKPDVTLSIVKNTKATKKNNEKLYYKESVYRADKQSHEYKEINQVGLEILGNIDKASTVEICSLAMKSLAVISDEYVLDVSHMGLISSFLDNCSIVSIKAREEILSCICSKNMHDLKNVCQCYNIDDSVIESLNKLINISSDFESALSELKKLLVCDEMKAAFEELSDLYITLKSLGLSDKIRLDLSLLNDIDYYNGLVFKGYINGIHKAVLSGGRYDKLTEKFNKSIGAMGFAIYLGDLLYFYDNKDEYDADILIIYDKDSEIQKVFTECEKLRNEGKIVRMDTTIPKDFKYRETVKM